MKIGFDAKRAFNNTRGLGNYSRNLISGLIAYFPENDYYLYGNAPDNEQLIQWHNTIQANASTVVPYVKAKWFQPLWRSFFINSVIESDDLDIYHGLSHEIPFHFKKSKTKYVVTIHDLLFLRFKHHFSAIDRQIYTSKIKYSCRHADQIIAVSQQTKADLINFLSVPEEKIKVVYQTCSPEFYVRTTTVKRNHAKNKYNLPEQFLLFVGALVKHKNIERIIEAIGLLPVEKRIPLVIIGQATSYKNELNDKIDILRLQKEVIFVNFVDSSDMPSIYQMARILIWPSLFEGFGIPIIEALFSGLPVITSKEGCFTEVGGPGSLYVNPNKPEEISKAIEDVLSDSELYAKMQEMGYKHAQQFHIQNTSRAIIDLYSSL